MKLNKILIGALGVTLIGTALTGCGPKDRRFVDGKFNISISARSSRAEQDLLKIWKQDYESKNPDVNIIIDGWGGIENSEDYIAQYALNRNQLTNIIYTTDDYTAYLAQLKNFVDLRPYYEASEETDYSRYYASMLHTTAFNGEFRPTTNYNGPYVSENGKSDNVKYGVYFAPREYNMPGFVLNRDCFSKIGMEVPALDENWTYEAFVKLVQDISDKIEEKVKSGDTTFSVYRACELNQLWEPIYTTFMKQLNGDGLFKFDENDDAIANLDSDANVAAFKSIIGAFGNNRYPYAIDQDFSKQDFNANTIFITPVSFPEVPNLMDTCPNVDFLPIPTEYVGAGCGGYGILVDKANDTQTVNGVTKKVADLCWDFIKYIITDEGQNIGGKHGLIQPVVKELANTGDWIEFFDEAEDHNAFCLGKELRLDTYNFAEPKTRRILREDIGNLFRFVFDKNSSEKDLYTQIASVTNVVNGHLKG